MTQMRSEKLHFFLVRCKEAYELVHGFLNDSLPWGKISEKHADYDFNPETRTKSQENIRISMNKLEKAIDGHGLEELAISYNGGKDCLVMLILLLAVIHKKYENDHLSLPLDFKLDSIYVNLEIPFQQVEDFINQSSDFYHLNQITIKCSMQQGFEHYLQDINPKVQAIIVGIRYADPYGENLQYEQCTDSNWPDFLRIHPILHWNYNEIWDFLLGCDLNYCEMYDHGYTSLGGIHNTVPNPKLKISSDKYLPAYKLTKNSDELERLGRLKNKTK